MTARPSFAHRRAIYDDDLQVRIDAAIARTRRFIKSTQAIRAGVRVRDDTTFTPRCGRCQQPGRPHKSQPLSGQRYICAYCHARWTLPLPTL